MQEIKFKNCWKNGYFLIKMINDVKYVSKLVMILVWKNVSNMKKIVRLLQFFMVMKMCC